MFLMNVFYALAAAIATPLWGSDPVLPGETALLFGEGMSQATAVQLLHIEDAKGRDWIELEPIQISEQAIKVALPDDGTVGLYAWRVRTQEGLSEEGFLNRPALWWVQGNGGDSASPGGWLRMFGKCLAFDGATPRVVLKQGGTERELSLSNEEITPYALRASIPTDLAEGRYEVQVHNGLGGSLGWSDAMELEVKRATPWPETRFDVTAFGAVGNDGKDDSDAIQKAIEAAKEAGGGIVFFSRGRYRLSEPLQLPPLVVLKGESRELVTLYWDDTERPPEAWIQGTHAFGVEDLTLNCANYVHVIAGDLGSVPEAGDVFIRRVRIRANIYLFLKQPELVDERFRQFLRHSSGGGDLIRLGGKNIEITDCDLYGSGRSLFLSKTRKGLVARNTFYNGRWGWYCISGSDGLIFEHNQLIGGDLMSTGGGLNCLDGSAYSQNIYFAHNVLKNLFGWDREAMTSDAGGGAYLDDVDSCDGVTLTLQSNPNWGSRDWRGAAVFIVGGRGAGQYRRIVRYEGRAIELESPWKVEPDATSEVSVTMLQTHYLLVGNKFSDATVSVQFYGISIEHIIAQNRSTRAGGFHNLGFSYAGGAQPSWFVQYFDNEILEGSGFKGPLNEYPPLDAHLATIGQQTPERHSPLMRGTVMRRNHLRNNARIEVRGFCEDVLIEHNTVENNEVGISVEESAKGVLLRENRFLNIEREIQ